MVQIRRGKGGKIWNALRIKMDEHEHGADQFIRLERFFALLENRYTHTKHMTSEDVREALVKSRLLIMDQDYPDVTPAVNGAAEMALWAALVARDCWKPYNRLKRAILDGRKKTGSVLLDLHTTFGDLFVDTTGLNRTCPHCGSDDTRPWYESSPEGYGLTIRHCDGTGCHREYDAGVKA